jgi:hypothetical protein
MIKFIIITLSLFTVIASIILLVLSIYQYKTFTKTTGTVKCKDDNCVLTFDKFTVPVDLSNNSYYDVYYKKNKDGSLKSYHLISNSFVPSFVGTVSYIVFFSLFTFLTILNLYLGFCLKTKINSFKKNKNITKNVNK